jgi:hypothetical protein
VRFQFPVRVAALEGPPRIIRTLTSNLSRAGAFVLMPQPLGHGTRVALSLEAGGQTFPLVEGEIAWCRSGGPALPGGFGLRFRRFLHPRGRALVTDLVDRLHHGRPLALARPRRRWLGLGLWGVGAAALSASATAGVLAWLPPPTLAPVAVLGVAPAPADAAPPFRLEAEAEALEPLPPPRRGDPHGEIPLPGGAASALAWRQADGELRLEAVAPAGRLRRRFLLASPPRVVFDLEGPPPVGSHVAAGLEPFVRRVRIGPQGQLTRVVVDLTRPPRDSAEDGEALVLSF